MREIEAVLNETCAEHRGGLATFAGGGGASASVSAHLEECLDCQTAVAAIAELRKRDLRETATAPRSGFVLPAAVSFGLFCILLLGIFGFLGYQIVAPFFRGVEEARTEIADLESRVRVVRLPGRPMICVAALPPAGGFSPIILGAAPCSEVDDRIAADEAIAWRLRDYAVTRIRGTDLCLAHEPSYRNDFTLPCGDDD